MAKGSNIYLQTLSFLFTVCFTVAQVNAQLPEHYRAQVVKVASRDISIFEERNNTGTVQKYVKFWNAHNKSFPLGLQSAYCGLALDYWYRQAGVNPNVYLSPRAINWQKYCKKPVAIWSATPAELAELKPAGALVFQSSHGNHVGLYLEYREFNLYTIEANTSTARSIDKYNRSGEGVFRLRTPVNNKALKPLYYCDVIKQAAEWKGK